VKPRAVLAPATYLKRVFAAFGVPDFRIAQRSINGTEMKGHVRLAVTRSSQDICRLEATLNQRNLVATQLVR